MISALLLLLAGPADVRVGMRADEVRAALGPPVGVARALTSHRVTEQWLYPGPPAQRLTFEARRGQPLALRTVTPVTP